MLNEMKSAFGGIKFIAKLLPLLILFFAFAGTSFAANFTSIRLQQPQSPTNENTFNITFAALDTNSSQSVSVQCYKKGPTDGSFIAFGSTINLTNGGNTDNCEAGGSIMNQGNGTYQFEAIASGSTSPTSNIVSVDFNNSTNPGAPEGYSKTEPDNCTYKITFKTADDSGKTIKVILYRSDQTSFNVDSGHQVNSLNIGSNTDGSMTDNISPNCDTNYYYAIRAFDVYGNGSDVRGDQNITTTIINPTAAPVQGAIPVSAEAGSVLGSQTGIQGEKTTGAGTEASKEVLGTTEAPQPTITPEVIDTTPGKSGSLLKSIGLVLIIAAILLAVYFVFRMFRRNKNI